jgi:hypothetical protein
MVREEFREQLQLFLDFGMLGLPEILDLLKDPLHHHQRRANENHHHRRQQLQDTLHWNQKYLMH